MAKKSKVTEWPIELTFDSSDLGDQLDSMLSEVLEDLDIEDIPSTQLGIGSVEFYDSDDQLIGECDYTTMKYALQEIYVESESESGCFASIKGWIQELLNI